MIAIVDYGAGNLASVKKAFDFLGATSMVTSDPAMVRQAKRVVVPGVGHFAATSVLADSGLREAALDVIARGIPFLGICVGMQWLFESSTESPQARGLGTFRGICERFPSEVKSPHVGWNQLSLGQESRLLKGVANDSFVYFTHSYRAPLVPETTAATEYGGRFSAVVERGNVLGVQFHPEKSSEVGLRILKNFCEMLPC